MALVAIFIVELLILYLLSRALTRHLSQLLYRLGLNGQLVGQIIAILFLPGTFLHEVSHYLMAVILRVRVYGFGLIPKQEGETIKLGSVNHAKVDLIRNLLIGAAPFIIGSLVTLSLLAYSMSYNPLGLNWSTLLLGYLVFEIGNTMFVSKKDLEGSLEFLLILLIFLGLTFLLGGRISLEQLDLKLPTPLTSLVTEADLLLLIPLGLDILVIGIMLILSRVVDLGQS